LDFVNVVLQSYDPLDELDSGLRLDEPLEVVSWRLRMTDISDKSAITRYTHTTKHTVKDIATPTRERHSGPGFGATWGFPQDDDLCISWPLLNKFHAVCPIALNILFAYSVCIRQSRFTIQCLDRPDISLPRPI